MVMFGLGRGGKVACMAARRPRTLTALVLLLFIATLWTFSSSSLVRAGAWLGDFYSELMVGGAGVGSSLLIGPASSEVTVVGGGPVVVTNPVSDPVLAGGATSATLVGNVSGLGGFPRAEVWFEWGYAAGALSNSTPHVVVAATGQSTAIITGWDPSETVYYRFVGAADGTNYGVAQSFIVRGGQGISYWILWHILPLILAAATLIVALRMGANWTSVLMALLTYIFTVMIIRNLLPALW